MMFTQHDDRTVSVDRFDVQLIVTPELIRRGVPGLIKVTGRRLLINCRNGSAVYRIVRRNRRLDFECQLERRLSFGEGGFTQESLPA